MNRKDIYLKLELSITDQKNHFYYSFDNKTYMPLRSGFEAKWGYWKGARAGLFNYNTIYNGGSAAFDFFHYTHDGPK